jgi:PTS system mannose-specific IIB component
MNIVLARVDDRLIHGQVMTKWSKGKATKAIYIIDDETYNDDFLKTIFESTGKRSGLNVKVFSLEAFKNFALSADNNENIILLFKNIKTVNNLINSGFSISDLNIGGVSERRNVRKVNPSVSLTQEMYFQLKSLEKLGVTINFQTVPDTKITTMKDIDGLW